MMAEFYKCTVCKSTEFTEVKKMNVHADGTLGSFWWDVVVGIKCAKCGTVYNTQKGKPVQERHDVEDVTRSL